MITDIKFTNFRAIQNAILPLQPLNLLVGPNGTGKTTVLQAIRYLKTQGDLNIFKTIGSDQQSIEVSYSILIQNKSFRWTVSHVPFRGGTGTLIGPHGPNLQGDEVLLFNNWRMQIRHYSFDAAKMRAPVQIQPYQELAEDGSNLAGFLDFLRDDGTSNFQNLERTLSECLPEFDEIGFDRPGPGTKALKLRRRGRNDHIPAPLLSEGTLYIVALIAIAYQANMPALICIEEPDHGIHPALYRRIYDTLCRLAFPKEYKETFNPIQVITTTHSPYFLNAFTDHPEHVIACEREVGKGVIFRNLGNDTTAKKILQDSLIGDAWASGALSSFEATVS